MSRSLRRGRRLAAALALAALAVTGAGIAGTAAQATPGEGEVRGAGAADAVPGQYIVVFKRGSRESQRVPAAASELTARHHGAVGHTYQRSVRGFSARLSERSARRLAAHPSVAYVEADRRARLVDTQNNPPWGLDRIDQRNLPLSASYGYATTASTVHAYILDTGIRTSHTEFGGRASDGRDLIDNDPVANDCHGHGTHVAGTVGGSTYGVAKGVKLVGVRVLDCAGSGWYSQVIAGVDWVTANAVKPAVANMSLGGGPSSALDEAVRASIASGVAYAVAAGNSNANACNYSPARTAEAITVGATSSTDARASFSNYGTCLDIFAPGVGITSSLHTSDTATATWSGTSMAAPHVAGTAALVLAEHPTYTAQQVRDALVAGASANMVTGPGSGSPNRLLFTGSTTAPDPSPSPSPSSPAPSPSPSATSSPTPTSSAPPSAPPCGPFSNTTDVAIPDLGKVAGVIEVSGCTGNGAKKATVTVRIKHTYRGDLSIVLMTGDGKRWVLKHPSPWDGRDDVTQTYTINASSAARNGTWKLWIQDHYAYDTGYLDSWTLTL